ncbi:MAG: sugar phosphate isomerase/epimerase [Planctomycetes bacterium]|nr:sugar phosphate isomerase/epimerase [Planctomycetota bacterium]
MRLGINLLLWTGHVGEQHRPVLEFLRETGYGLVEIPVMSGAVEHYAELGRWLDELGLARTSSMAFTDPAADPSSPDPVVRRAAREQMAWQIDCAAALGATKVIGPMVQTLGRRTGAGPTEAELAGAAEVLADAAERAQAVGVVLAIEALNRFECHLCNTLAAAQALAARVDHPALGIMVDTFHANIEEKDTPAAIRAAGPAIRHVHLSESDRGVPGTGQVDFPAVLAALRDIGYDGDLVIEAFGRAVPELAAATCVWRDLAPSPEELAIRSMEEFCGALSAE